MAVYFVTGDASGLLHAFREAIDGDTIETWSYDEEGDFTHTPDQWESEAWFTPSVDDNRLSFFIVPPLNETISREVYAVYHGRLIEALLAHFDDRFENAIATAYPENDDTIKSMSR